VTIHHAVLFLDKSPRFLDAKGATMLGLTFMAKEKKGRRAMH
jgi:hypothetical protein